ncbi:hypothetical protein L3X38_035989 [Prunus dulcis]|uniref:Reverse transcriptase RNase H-like domain-containing protein n=2 Tax=Prunus dulcis TaxID=3755 RepID=A0AAD4VKQ0_PRUDU|nr:hypothetical protein L3X38_035989 [Prunus dulcis]
MEHKLPIKEGYLPVKQARRRMFMDTELKVKDKIKRLLKARFIRLAIYVDWLANIVPILKRKTEAIRICVDYRNLNEASPKDEYPMPMADMLVDGAAHNQMLSFMDGNAGYNQIIVAEEDIHRTTFMLPGNIGAFEYTVMPFGLRNAGATYQRAMNSVFHDMIGHSLEVYIEIKSSEEGNHASNLRKAFLSRGRPPKLYVSASEVSIGSLLVQDNKEGKEQAIYYLSRTLTEVERKYSAIERLCLALYFTVVKLRHYMLPFTIYIIAKIDLIQYMLTRPMLRGRIGKWTLALTEFAFRYVPQKAVKGQAVADFLADYPGEEIENMNSLDIANANLLTRGHTFLNNPIYSVHLTPWELNAGGIRDLICGNPGRFYACVETDCFRIQVSESFFSCLFSCSSKPADRIQRSYLGTYPKRRKFAANELAQIATGIQMPEDYVQRIIKVGKKSLPSVLTRGMEIDVNSAIITEDDWRNPIINYLQYPTLPSEKRVRIMALNYLMWNGDLVRKTKDEVLLRCFGKKEYMKIMGETHEGIHRAHQGGRKMCWLIRRYGYFWPTMIEDCIDYSKGCEACQRHGPM